MGSAYLPQVTAAFHEALCRQHGPCILEDGIRLTVQAAAAKIAAGYIRPHSSQNSGLRAFASEAGGCARQIGLRMLDLKPMDITPELAATFEAGDMLHEKMQEGMSILWPELSVEHSWCKDYISGRADGFYGNTIVEIKSCSLKSFKYAQFKGPKLDHTLQASLSALHLGASKIHIIYIAKEPAKTAVKTWADAGKPEYISIMDWVQEVDLDATQDEWGRLSTLAVQISEGILGDTENAIEWISDPSTQTWPCKFCAARSLCIDLGPGTQNVARLKAIKPSHTFPDLVLAEDRA